MSVCDEKKPYIFVSYSHRDTERVVNIINRMRKEGYNVWYDEGIDPGTEWDENIATHVQNCGYFIAFISDNYINSKNCKDELNYSRDLDKDQLLVYLDDVNLPGGMAMRMNRIQAIFWNRYDDNYENAFEKLFSAQGIERCKTLEASETEISAAKENESKAPSFATPTNDEKNTKEQAAGKSKKWIVPVVIVACVLIALGVLWKFVFAKKGLSQDMKQALAYIHADECDYNPQSALALFEKEADSGNADAAFLAGYVLTHDLRGTVDEDFVTALSYYEKAGENNPYAKIMIGEIYNNAYAGTLDEKKAEILFEEAISGISREENEEEELSYLAEAEVVLAKAYLEGYSVEVDGNRAVSLMEDAVERGSMFANYQLATTYFKGKGINKDLEKALKYAQKIADAGSSSGMNVLGVIYQSGSDSVPKDIESAVKFYERAAEKGSYYAMKNLATMYKKGEVDGYKDLENYIKWLERAAEAGHRDAMCEMGDAYREGKADIKTDINRAMEWYEKAGNAGCGDGYFEIGYLYINGITVAKDEEKGNEYYKKAKDLGSAAAMNNLAVYYNENKEYELSFANYQKAAELGNIKAKENLAKVYYYGNDYIKKDINEALKWLEEAAADDSSYANATLGHLYRDGSEDVAKNIEKAVTYLEAAETGNGQYLREIGDIYYLGENKDFEEAMKWYVEAAELGDYTSACQAMVEYWRGEYLPKDKDKSKAYHEYLKAHMDELDALTQRNVRIYENVYEGTFDANYLYWDYKALLDEVDNLKDENGRYVPACLEITKYLVERVKDKDGFTGDTSYPSYLCSYFYATGVIKEIGTDYKKAIEYAEEGVEIGGMYYQYCLAILGDIYANDKYSGKDIEKAKSYYTKAIEEGYYDPGKMEEKIKALE